MFKIIFLLVFLLVGIFNVGIAFSTEKTLVSDVLRDTEAVGTANCTALMTDINTGDNKIYSYICILHENLNTNEHFISFHDLKTGIYKIIVKYSFVDGQIVGDKVVWTSYRDLRGLKQLTPFEKQMQPNTPKSFRDSRI